MKRLTTLLSGTAALFSLLPLLLPGVADHQSHLPDQDQLILWLTALCLLVCLIAAVRWLLYPQQSLSLTRTDLWISLFIGWILIRSLPTDHPILLLPVLCLPVLYFLYRSLSVGQLRILLWILPLCALIQLRSNYLRIEEPWQSLANGWGIFGNTGIWGGFVALASVIVCSFTLQARTGLYRFGGWLLLIPLLYALVVSQSRAAWCAFLAAIIWLTYDTFRLQLPPRLSPLFRRLLLLIGIVLVCCLYFLKKESADGRLLIWMVAAGMCMQAPFTGWGVHGFRTHYMEHQADYFDSHPHSSFLLLADESSHAFNELLRIGVELGLPGIALAIALFFSVRKKEEQVHPLQRPATALLIGWIVFSFFSYPLSYLQFRLVLLLAIAILSQRETPIKLFSFSKTLHPRFLPATLCLVCLALLPASFTHLSRQFHAQQTWKQVYSRHKTDPATALATYRKLCPALSHSPVFLYRYAEELFRNGQLQPALEHLRQARLIQSRAYMYTLEGRIHQETKDFEAAQNCWIQAHRMIPCRLRPHYLMMKMHQARDDTDNMLLHAWELWNKKEKVHSPASYTMKQEARQLLLQHNKISDKIDESNKH